MRRNTIFAAVLVFLTFWAGSAFASVSYLGPAGTYTEEATILFFGTGEKIIPAPNVPAALALLKAGNSNFSVVPVENTIGGPVYNYLDAVLADKDLTIVGEVDLPIRQTLLAVKGTRLEDIKTILSHPQGITQSKEWIKANLPDAKLVEVSSTAEAAKRVAEAGDQSIAAIAASRTANVYSLEVLANDLQYTTTNVTRFWVVALKGKAPQSGDKAAAVVSGTNNSVIRLLYELSKMGYQVQTVHDRPTKEKLGEYTFVIEVTGLNPGYALEKLLARPDTGVQGRVLGSFNSK